MFETSSILSMLGMATQLKSAGQGSSAVQVLPSAMQTDPGIDPQGPQALVQNSSLFQLMLSFALPQGQPQTAQTLPAGGTDANVSQSIALPFKNEKSDAPIEEEGVTASVMMPFYPVQWNAVSAAQQVKPAEPSTVAAETETTAGVGVGAALNAGGRVEGLGIHHVKENGAPIETMKQTAPIAQDVKGNAATIEMMKQNAPANPAAQASGLPIDAASPAVARENVKVEIPAGMLPVVEDAPQGSAETAVNAAAQQGAKNSEVKTSVPDALADARVSVQTVPRQSVPVTVEQPASVNEQPIARTAAAVAVTGAAQADGKNSETNLVSAEGLQTKNAVQPVATHVLPSSANQIDEGSAKNIPATGTMASGAAVLPVTQYAGDGSTVSEQQALLKTIAADRPISVPKIEVTDTDRAAAAVVEPAETVRPVQTETAVLAAARASGEPTPIASMPRKNSAARAWAESLMRKYAPVQGESVPQKNEIASPGAASGIGKTIVQSVDAAGSVQKIQPAETTSDALPVQAVKNPADQAPAQIQQQIVTAPETQVKLHAAVMAAAEPDAVKNAAKAAVTVPAAANAPAEESVPASVQNIPEKLSAAPAIDAAVRAAVQPETAQTKMRDDAAALPRTELAQEVRAVKVETPTQQPLANVADVQRQFVPLHEAAPAATPRVREEVFEKIFKEVSSIKHTPTTVNVTLSPESMGTVTVKVGVEEGKMAARIDVQNVEVKHIIETNMPRLQDALQSNGLSLDSISVFVNAGSTHAEKRHDAPRRKSTGAPVRSDDGFEPLSALRDSKQYGYNTVEYIM
jgi:hypothetical protein